MSTPSERPALLSVGIIATAVLSAISLLTLLAVMAAIALGVAIALPAAVSGGEEDAVLPILGGGLLGTAVLGLWAGVQAVHLLLCWGAWTLDRTWLVLLLVVTVLGLLFDIVVGAGSGLGCCCLPVTAIVDLLLFAGIVQTLSR